MKPELFLQIMDRAEQLKTTPGILDLLRPPGERGGAQLAPCSHGLFVKDEFPQADLEKLLAMCLLHDMGEAFTGDIPAFEKSPEDERRRRRFLPPGLGISLRPTAGS